MDEKTSDSLMRALLELHTTINSLESAARGEAEKEMILLVLEEISNLKLNEENLTNLYKVLSDKGF
jgi:hypothetical protein